VIRELTILTIAAALLGTSPSARAAGPYRDGEYFGMSRREGIGGSLKILATIEKGRLREISFLALPDLPGTRRTAPVLRRQALRAQGPRIGGEIREGFLPEMFQEALGNALSRAGRIQAAPEKQSSEKAVRVEFLTTSGPLEVEFYPEAGEAARNCLALARRGHYNGKIMYRALPRTLVYLGEGDSPGGRGGGAPGGSFDAVGMVGSAGDGIIFFNAIRAPWLDGQYPLIGRVVRGFGLVAEVALAPKESSEIRIIAVRETGLEAS